MVDLVRRSNGLLFRQNGKLVRATAASLAAYQACCCNCSCDDIPDTVYYYGNHCGAFTVTLSEIVSADPGGRVWQGTGTINGNDVLIQFGCTDGDPCDLYWCTDGCLGAAALCNEDTIGEGAPSWTFLGSYAGLGTFDITADPTAPSGTCDVSCLDNWTHRFSTTAPP